MKFFRSAAVLGVAMIGAWAPSFGANSDVTVTPTAVPVEVSVSRQCTASGCALKSYAAFEITVANATSNVINQVLFKGTTEVVDPSTVTAPISSFVESIGAQCSATNAPSNNTISCDLGQLRGSTTFVVIFNSPPSGTSLNFPYSVTYSRAQSPQTPSSEGTFAGNVSATLVTADAQSIRKSLKTYVPSIGGTFFTGNNASALDVLIDPSTTKLGVPANLSLKTAEIAEDVTTGGQTNDTTHTNTTTIKIPASSLFAEAVTVELRRDSSTIRAFNKIARVPLYYTSEAGEPVVLDNVLIPSCTDSSVYSPTTGPSAANPVCVSKRIAISSRTVDEAIPVITDDDLGDWLFILKVLQNGRILY